MVKVHFSNLTFKGLTKDELLQDDKKMKIVITVNAELIVYAQINSRFRKIINTNLSTFDGQIPFLIAKMKNKKINFEKISGSDFIYTACEFSKKNNLKVFLLGGNEKSNHLSVQKLKSKYKIKIEGFSPEYKSYPFDKQHNQKILKKIESFRPKFLFVGFGPIKQEFWIDDNKTALEKIGVKWVINSGGTFEIVSGQFERAPLFIQKIGLERIYRFYKDPSYSRFKRLLISIKFFKYIFR